jgi:sulfite reductase (ferredoxin)
VVTVMVPLGDLGSSTLRGLAALVKAYGADHARIAIDQNLVLPNVRRADLRSLHDGLRDIGLAGAGAGTALDVTSCPGADTCNLGITSSKGLTRAIRSRLLPMFDNGGMDTLGGVSIKISGCPNSCGQHHVAGIGLHGVARRNGSRQLPAYQLHLGGRIGRDGSRIGKATFKIPAKTAPDAIAALLERFRREREEGDSFPDFIDRIPRADLEVTLRPFLDEGALTEESFIDWGQTSAYSTDDIGVGECAGAGTDVSAAPFDEYEAETHQASLFMRRGQWIDALANLNRSQYTIARVLLNVLGKSPESDYEVECAVRGEIIDRGHASELWNEYHERIEGLLRTRRPNPASVERLHRMSGSLLEESRNTYVRLTRLKATRGPVEIPA